MRNTLFIVFVLAGCTTPSSESPALDPPGSPTQISGRATVEAGVSPDVLVLQAADDVTLCLTGTAFADKFKVGDVVEISGHYQSALALAGERCMKFEPDSVVAAP